LKQNVLIWSAYYCNESKTIRFGQQILSQVDRFHSIPKIQGRSKAIWFDLEIVFGNVERFYLIQKLIDQSKTF
jgi:hypothetical protein